jgi:Tfp pilus assembly protein PilF
MNASEVRRDSRRVGGGAVSRTLALLGILLLAPGILQAKDKFTSSASEELAFGVQMAQRLLWSEALFRFRQAEKLEPGNVRAMNNIAVALEAIGRFEDALAAYQTALKADPTNVELKRNYGRFVEFYQSFKTKPKTEPVVPAAPPPGGAF